MFATPYERALASGRGRSADRYAAVLFAVDEGKTPSPAAARVLLAKETTRSHSPIEKRSHRKATAHRNACPLPQEKPAPGSPPTLARRLAAGRTLSRYARPAQDDPLRVTEVAESLAVLVALQLANELRAAGPQASDDSVDVVDGECDMADARGVRARVRVAGPTRRSVKNSVSSSRPWPSGVCTIAISARTPTSPTTRSTQLPSTGPHPAASVRARRRTLSRPGGRRPRCGVRAAIGTLLRQV
jgi:hypothetical protein